jgi:hypothetical protein
MRLAHGRIVPAIAAILLLGCARAVPPRRPVDASRTVALPPGPDALAAVDGGGDLSAPGTIGRLGEGLGAAHVAQGVCGEIEAAWRKRLAAGGQCTRAADCACYTSSLWAPFGADATDVATAKALGKLARKFATHPCPTACLEGTPERCRADCVGGRCVAVPLPPDGARPRHRTR